MTQRNGWRAILIVLICAQSATVVPRLARAQESAPVLDSVTMHEDAGGRYVVIYPEFHFHDASGTVRYIHREVVATNAPIPVKTLSDGIVNISANQQIRGATYVGGWHCGPETYYVTLRAFLMNLAGAKSNVVEYTIHCNGG